MPDRRPSLITTIIDHIRRRPAREARPEPTGSDEAIALMVVNVERHQAAIGHHHAATQKELERIRTELTGIRSDGTSPAT